MKEHNIKNPDSEEKRIQQIIDINILENTLKESGKSQDVCTVEEAFMLGIIDEAQRESCLIFCDAYHEQCEKGQSIEWLKSSEINSGIYYFINVYLPNQVSEYLSGREYDCCICGKHFKGYGNNPYPIKAEGRCCFSCNEDFVKNARITGLTLEQIKEKIDAMRIDDE